MSQVISESLFSVVSGRGVQIVADETCHTCQVSMPGTKSTEFESDSI